MCPSDIWQWLETFLVFKTRGVPASVDRDQDGTEHSVARGVDAQDGFLTPNFYNAEVDKPCPK